MMVKAIPLPNPSSRGDVVFYVDAKSSSAFGTIPRRPSLAVSGESIFFFGLGDVVLAEGVDYIEMLTISCRQSCASFPRIH